MSRSKLYTQSEMHAKHIVDTGEMQSVQLERHERFPPPLPEAVVHVFKQYLHCLRDRGITLEEEGGGVEGDFSMLNITQIAFTCLQCDEDCLITCVQWMFFDVVQVATFRALWIDSKTATRKNEQHRQSKIVQHTHANTIAQQQQSHKKYVFEN